jgi:hypothetical protein
VAEALADTLAGAPGDPIVVLIGEEAALGVLFAGAPKLRGGFTERWTFPGYSGSELTDIAVRHLLRRGHEVPGDVRDALAELVAGLPEPTVPAAHRLSAGLARTAASRTLTVADVTGFIRFGRAELVDGGLASVS